MKIVIVTTGSLGSNPRVVKEAQTLVDAGHKVSVICTKVADFVEPRDRSIMEQAAYEITRLDFSWLGARALDRILAAAARVGFALTGNESLAVHGHSLMTRRLTAAAKAIPADLYIAHYVGALPAAASAAKYFGAHFAFDAEDFHLGDLPDEAEFDLDRRLIRAIEGKYLPHASYVSVAAPLIAMAYEEIYKIAKPTAILNTFPRTSAAAEPTPKGTIEPGPSLYWFSQTIGPGRGLEVALEAISMAKSMPHLHLRGSPTPGYQEQLMGMAATLGVSDRLHFHTPIVPDQLEKSGAEFDIGFIGELSHTRNRQIALTNKLFSYLTSGLPIIASSVDAHKGLTESLGDALRLYNEQSADELASHIDEMLSDPAAFSRSRTHAWHLGRTAFSWEAEEPKLLQLVSNFDRK